MNKLFLLILFFLLTRILHLLFCSVDLFQEDLLRGTLAKELIEGLRIPFFDYAADHYHGGSLVYGLLTVPLFLLLGKSIFSLRLTAVFFQWGAFILWTLFMKRFFGKKAALYTALLYLFSPPWLTLYAMYGHGAHAESLLFTAIGLFLLFRILYEGKRPLRDGACLGLVSGFGAYFTYGVFVSVATFVFFWFYEDRRLFRKKEFLFFFLFFLIGFSPWFVYNGLYQLQGIERISGAFAYSEWEQVFIIPFRFLKLATLKILGMFSFNYRGETHYHPHITLLNVFYYVALLFSYGILYRFERKNKKVHFFFLLPMNLLLIASLSRLDIRTSFPHYFIPLFPFFFAVMGLGLARLGTLSNSLQKVSLAILFFLLAMGIKGELNLLSLKRPALSLKHQGYSYRQLGGAFTLRYPKALHPLSRLGRRLESRLPRSERFAFHLGLSEIYYDVQNMKDLEKYLSWIKSFDYIYQPFYLEEMGRMWGLVGDEVFSKKIEDASHVLEKEDQPYVMKGLIRSLSHSHMKPDQMFEYAFRQMKRAASQNQKALAYAMGELSWQPSTEASFLDKVKRHHGMDTRLRQELLPVYYRGVGALMAHCYDSLSGRWPFSPVETMGQLDKEWQEVIVWGAGFEAPLLFEDPYEWEKMKEELPLQWRKRFEKGLSDRFAWGGRNQWIEE